MSEAHENDTAPGGIADGRPSLAKQKAALRWEGKRVCRNCIYARELTFEEYQRLHGQSYPPDIYCEHPKTRSGYGPHAVRAMNHCFEHEYDDESVMLPKDPQWCTGSFEKCVDLWPYEEKRRDAIMNARKQISIDEAISDHE